MSKSVSKSYVPSTEYRPLKDIEDADEQFLNKLRWNKESTA